MEASMDERLEQAVATLDTLIERIGAGGLADSVFFLEMAKMQLKLDLNGVTDEEFGTFCDALERGTLASSTLSRPGQQRAHPGGDLRGQRRARTSASDIAKRRVGRRRAGH